MPTLVAIGYPDQGTAEQSRQTVYELESDLVTGPRRILQTAAVGSEGAGVPPTRRRTIGGGRRPADP